LGEGEGSPRGRVAASARVAAKRTLDVRFSNRKPVESGQGLQARLTAISVGSWHV
jgi:hypothetical protein